MNDNSPVILLPDDTPIFKEALDTIHRTIDRVAKERDISLNVNFWEDGTVSFSVYPYGSVSTCSDPVCDNV